MKCTPEFEKRVRKSLRKWIIDTIKWCAIILGSVFAALTVYVIPLIVPSIICIVAFIMFWSWLDGDFDLCKEKEDEF